MRIYVTRHGQTEWNALGKLQGRKDIELNEVGREQAVKVRNKLKNEKIDIIISSTLKRAKETAKIINKEFNVDIIEDIRLIEKYCISNTWKCFDSYKMLFYEISFRKSH